MRKSRMFEGLTTWNPVFGCEHHCYGGRCWARVRFAHRWGKRFNCSDCYDFKPHFAMGNCRKTPVPPDPRIFVVAHGDLWGNWVPDQWIEDVLKITRHYPKEMWFFETKNPERYIKFSEDDLFPENTVLSTTIETNRPQPPMFSKDIVGIPPPDPGRRYRKMITGDLEHLPKHVSIEPIMEFDLPDLVLWIKDIRPDKVSIGYDSLNNRIPEPRLAKTRKLIKILENDYGIPVERKLLRKAWWEPKK